MSHDQTASSTQASIALNPQTLTALIFWLDRAKTHAHDLIEQFNGCDAQLALVELAIEVSIALDLVNKPLSEQEQTTTPTPPKKQQTAHRYEVDGLGYDCRVLLDSDHEDYEPINPECNPPAGYRQVCIHCGFDSFDKGTVYLDCPQCSYRVVHHCRYVAIVEGV